MIYTVTLLLACASLAVAEPRSIQDSRNVELAVAPRSCVVVKLSDQHLQAGGEPWHVFPRAAAGQGSCQARHFRVRGLEQADTFLPASCQHPLIVQPDAGLATLSALPAWQPLGSAFLTVESSCLEPATLTLTFSSKQPGSGAIPRRLRKLLQQAVPPSVEAQQGGAPSQDGDKYRPEQPTPAITRPMQNATATGMPQGNATLVFAPSPAAAAAGNASDPNGMACCCRFTSGVLPYLPDEYSGPTCCCGERSRCCQSGSLLTRICGDRSTCGVMLIVVGVVCLFLFSVCIMGGFCIRRRRRGTATAAAAEAEAGTGRRRPPPSAEDAECERLIGLPPEKQAEVLVAPAGEAQLGTQIDCPICLEPFTTTSDNWRVFPCAGHHGACAGCTADLVRFNRRRRASEHKRVVHCPLCRELAVVPRELLPADVLAIVDAPPERRSSRRSSGGLQSQSSGGDTEAGVVADDDAARAQQVPTQPPTVLPVTPAAVLV